MALTIEDGSGVEGANSYVTVDEIRVFATARGFSTLPVNDADVEPLAIKAMDYLEALEEKFKGRRTDFEQELCWPRLNVYLFDSTTMFSSTAIPVQLKKAQSQLAMEAVTLDLLPTGEGRQVVKEKVDVIETEYANTQSTNIRPVFDKVDALLAPLFNNSFGRIKLNRL